VLLALCVAGGASAQTASVAACVPYKMPIDSTITACGGGQIGSKYKTATKVCPSGAVTESADYDTSGCTAAPPPPGTVNNSTRCALMPDSCAVSPVAQNCPSGAHWSLLGSGIAHCVQDDPVCPWGTTLKHDAMGNPNCEQNTCPSNQVLQSDGKSCACPSGTGWTGSTCSAPTCAPSTTSSTGSCPANMNGTVTYYNYTSCPSGIYGAPAYSSSTDSSNCTPAPPTCTASSYQDYGSCNSGQTGSSKRWVYTSCPGGSYGSPSTSYSGWDYSACTTPAPTCTPTSSTYATACGSGYTGTKYVTTYQNCPSGTSSSENTSGCGCANGGNNYPTCTPPYTPPPPPPQPACPPMERFCEQDFSQNTQEMDGWSNTIYQYGVYDYEGPNCTVQRYVNGTQYDSCPPGF
jgi:hypothetical protein